MYKTQHPVLIFTYRGGFSVNIGNENPIIIDEGLPFSQQPISSPFVFDSVKKHKFYFRPLNSSNSFGTVDYDALFKTMIDFSINHVIKS